MGIMAVGSEKKKRKNFNVTMKSENTEKIVISRKANEKNVVKFD